MSRHRYGDGRLRPRPRLPADGIVARTQRGEFGETWWAKRWIAAVESVGWGGRLTRGRSYARGGAVTKLDITPGKISASVQGSQPKPYRISISVPQLSNAIWERAIDAMAEQALFSAKLLAGEMPQEIEEAFVQAGVKLFPSSAAELVNTCSCPDPVRPCKHIAAVYYLTGERFDEDPFLFFELRGRGREQVMKALRARRADDTPVVAVADLEHGPALAELLEHFYEPGGDLGTIEARIAAPTINGAILRRYGPPPAEITDKLVAIYRAMSAGAIERVFGE
jgi:uncharacterized Zn finger protein